MVRFLLFIGLFWITFSAKGSGSDCSLTLSYFIITGQSPVHQFKLVYNQNADLSNLTNRTAENQSVESRSLVKIPVNLIQGDNTMIISDFRDMVKMKEYPEIILDIHTGQLLNLDSGNTRNIMFYITIAQTTKLTSALVSIHYDKNRSAYNLDGRLSIDLKNFDLKPPVKFFGLMKVRDDVDIEFKLIFDPGLNEMNMVSDSHFVEK
jgi:hypothetical protein